MTRTLWSALAACLILAGCSGGSPSIAPPPGDPQAKGGPTAQLLRDTSGAPAGVRVSWERVEDVTGYNLYRMGTSIPDSELGKPGNRVNGALIPNTVAPDIVVYDDLFAVSVGEVWYYRVSAVDDSGDEGNMSPENAITISDFVVTQLEDVTGGVGDQVGINGERFGNYDPAGDKVFFPGVQLDVINGDLVPTLIEATVISWELSRITCTVPLGTTSGQVRVQSNGLSQDTPETFTNTDPYIENVMPVQGFADTNVQLLGRNFGAAQDFNHRVLVDNKPLLAGNYVGYSDTQITFHLDSTFFFDQPLEIVVQVQGTSSNKGQFIQANRPPVAALVVVPVDGMTPLNVDLDASGSVEPDGDFMLFSWDWEGDGTVDFDSGFDSTVSHTYVRAGDFNPTVYVTDSVASTVTATVPVHVSLSRLMLADNGTFAPNTEFYQTSLTVPISYSLSGGEPAYGIDWYLVDPINGVQFLLANDTDVAYGDGFREFDIDTTVSAEDGTPFIPAGQWRIQAVARDSNPGNDPDPAFSWPNFANGTPGTFFVYRYDVFLVIDAQGDPSGTESTTVADALTQLGYKVSMKSSNNLTAADFTGRDVVVWPADDAYGNVNFVYGWLSPEELAMARQYLDGGGRMVFFGPPIEASTSPFQQDQAFSRLYQPFMQVSPATVNGQVVPLEHYAASHVYALDSFSVSGPVGVSPETLQGTSESQASVFDATGVSVYMAARSLASGGKLFLGMTVFSDITSTSPPGTTRNQLLDNIVAGTIETP